MIFRKFTKEEVEAECKDRDPPTEDHGITKFLKMENLESGALFIRIFHG